MFGSLRYNIGAARNSNGPVPFACIKRKQGNFKPEIPFQNNTGLPWTASQKGTWCCQVLGILLVDGPVLANQIFPFLGKFCGWPWARCTTCVVHTGHILPDLLLGDASYSWMSIQAECYISICLTISNFSQVFKYSLNKQYTLHFLQ